MALEKGTTLAGYQVSGILGQGGMGVVYEATQISLNRTVALKVLAPHLSDDISFRERFRREGQIQAGIDHDHIVTVYEAGESEHGFFIAMRLIRGPNLKDMIVARQLDPGRTLRILSPIADALDMAHDAGLIHRDIKPQNILVGGRDQAFLADFGLTKATGEQSLTRTGQFVGTFDYISPEQIKGDRATTQSDVYSLAAVLYECFTGVVPYPKDSEAAVLYAHMADPPPKITDHRPELPATLDEVIATGMAKEPAERYETTRATAAGDERVLHPPHARRLHTTGTDRGPTGDRHTVGRGRGRDARGAGRLRMRRPPSRERWRRRRRLPRGTPRRFDLPSRRNGPTPGKPWSRNPPPHAPAPRPRPRCPMPRSPPRPLPRRRPGSRRKRRSARRTNLRSGAGRRRRPP